MINTIQGESIEGINATGKKIIVNGMFCSTLIVQYKRRSILKQETLDINIPFNTHIMVERDVCKINNSNLRCFIEDMSQYLINENTILISATILIQYA